MEVHTQKAAGRRSSVEAMGKRSEQRRLLRKLHEAVSLDNTKFVDELPAAEKLEFDIDQSRSGFTALQAAISRDGPNTPELCRCLIEKGADVNRLDPSTGDCPIHDATRAGRGDIVRLLAEAGADTNVADGSGMTPLGIAAATNSVSVAEALLKAGCYVNRADGNGATPLITSAHHGHVEVARCITSDSEVELNWTDKERRTALIVAAQQGHLQMVQFLIDAGCDLDAGDKYSSTALYFAAKYGHGAIVKCLVAAGADLNKSDTKGYTPFTMAVESLQMDIVKLLIAAGCNIDTADCDFKFTAIHNAVRFSTKAYGQRDLHHAIVRLLLESNCDVNVSDKLGWTPLYFAAYSGETDIVRQLLKKNADVTKMTNNLDTALHGAVVGNQPEITDMLIKAGCQVNQVNNKNKLPLYMAVESRHENQIVRLLLEAGSETNICESKSSQSPLFVAVKQQYIEGVELLIKAGCDVNLPNIEGDTPLWLASSLGNDRIVNLLLSHPEVDTDRGVCRAPLHAAAVFGSYSIAVSLIKAGCDVNKLSDIGVSALFLAAEMNHFPVAQLLVRHGANPSAAHRLQYPSRCCRAYRDAHPHLELEPLFAAVQNDSLPMIKLILVATPRMPYSALRTLRDIVFRTNYAREARLTERTITQYAHFFVGVLAKPRALRDECRGVIRHNIRFGRQLGLTLTCAVGQLPLPDRLKDYVLLHNESIVGV